MNVTMTERDLALYLFLTVFVCHLSCSAKHTSSNVTSYEKNNSSTVDTSSQVNPKIYTMDDRRTRKKGEEFETCSLPHLFCLGTKRREIASWWC